MHFAPLYAQMSQGLTPVMLPASHKLYMGKPALIRSSWGQLLAILCFQITSQKAFVEPGHPLFKVQNKLRHPCLYVKGEDRVGA